MSAGPAVAVVGATGAVGRELLAILEERRFPAGRLELFASERSAGVELEVLGQRLPVQPLARASFDGSDLAFFSCGAETARLHVPRALAAGARVIDNSSAFRLDPSVPLVVPECNADRLFGADGPARLVANPNCSTILLAVVLAPLARRFGLKRAVVATYQAASGAGAAAMRALEADLGAGFTCGRPNGEAWRGRFPHPLAGNLIPHIDRFQADGRTREEVKIADESRKILELEALPIDATCVRVPVLRSHCEAVVIETERPCRPAEARRVLAEAPGLAVVDDMERFLYPMPLHASGRDEVLVGRLRASRAFEHGLAFWLAGDQLRKGAALNAVQIAELLLAGVGGSESPRDESEPKVSS